MGLYHLFVKGPEFELNYNCSFYSVEDVPLEKRQHRVFAVIVFSLGVLFELLYLPCLYALSRKKLLQSNFCYKLMFLMTIEVEQDMVTLAVTTLLPGYMSFYGLTYCSNPDLVYFFGAIIIGNGSYDYVLISFPAFWLAYSQTSLLLAINRCLSFSKYKYIFDGLKPVLFKLDAIRFPVDSVHFLFHRFVFLCFCFIQSSPVYNAWFFDPHRGYYDDLVGKYSSDLQFYNNIVFIIAMPIIYVIFVVNHFCMSCKGREGGMPKKEVALFIQTLIVNFTIAMSALGYTIMQYLDLPPEAIAVTHISWVIVEGTPPVVYLTINQTIRRIVIEGKNEFSSWIGVKRATPNAVQNSSHVSIQTQSNRRVSNISAFSQRPTN
ncbi:Serpentine Receptor, class T [Aphelenchoides besseyi]|nr:Serpentine Receptor, class T [Aphelenchoides besseyi]